MTHMSRKMLQLPLGYLLKEDLRHPHNAAAGALYSGNKQLQKPPCLAENTRGNIR